VGKNFAVLDIFLWDIYIETTLRKHHRSSDHRSSESITEVQIVEAQKVS
jgi:hypothetical protein